MDNQSIINLIEVMKNNDYQSLLFINDVNTIKELYYELIKLVNVESDSLIVNFRFPSINEKKELSSKDIITNKIFFIDGVCVSADAMPDDDSIDYLMSSKDLDGIIVNLDSVCTKSDNLGYVILDLLDPLLLYNSIEDIKKMIDDLKFFSANHKIKIIIFITEQNDSLIKEVSSKFDKVIGTKSN